MFVLFVVKVVFNSVSKVHPADCAVGWFALDPFLQFGLGLTKTKNQNRCNFQFRFFDGLRIRRETVRVLWGADNSQSGEKGAKA
jgi:hypothetical protein